tara:strand:+ start:3153 stop:3383 length:231 start_codon:yes stop_codon:yes gene_type:complete
MKTEITSRAHHTLTAYQEGRKDAFALVAESIRTGLERNALVLNPVAVAVLEDLEESLREQVWRIVYPENQHENERS